MTHRRAGRHLPGRTRRDPRRVAMGNRASAVGPWPAVARLSGVYPDTAEESLAESADAPSARNRTTTLKQGERLRLQH